MPMHHIHLHNDQWICHTSGSLTVPHAHVIDEAIQSPRREGEGVSEGERQRERERESSGVEENAAQELTRERGREGEWCTRHSNVFAVFSSRVSVFGTFPFRVVATSASARTCSAGAMCAQVTRAPTGPLKRRGLRRPPPRRRPGGVAGSDHLHDGDAGLRQCH